MDGSHASRLLKLSPGMVGSHVMDCLLALKSQGHLFNIIMFVAGLVGILSIVDM